MVRKDVSLLLQKAAQRQIVYHPKLEVPFDVKGQKKKNSLPEEMINNTQGYL